MSDGNWAKRLRWSAMGTLLACGAASAGTVTVPTGYVGLLRFEITGNSSSLFGDDFCDGERGTPPTSSFIDLAGSITSEGTVPSPAGPLCALLFGGDDGASDVYGTDRPRDIVSLDVGLPTSAMDGSFDAYFFPLPADANLFLDLATGLQGDPGAILLSFLSVYRTTDPAAAGLPPECLTDPFVMTLESPESGLVGCDPLILDVDPALELSMRLDSSGQSVAAAYSSLSATTGGSFPTPHPSSEWVVPLAGIPVGDATTLYATVTVVRTALPEPESAGACALAALATLVHGRSVRRRH